MIAAYRLKQGTRALTALARPVDDGEAQRALSPQLYALFLRMRRSERQHSLNVLGSVQREGDVPPALMVAALLHDCGKIRYPLRTWQRSLPVIVGALSPNLLSRLASGRPERAWSRGFVVYVHHPAWSAALLREAGASDDAVWLAEHHADPADLWRGHLLFHLLERLQAADDTN